MNKKAIQEATKELLRIAFFGALASVLSWVTTKVANLDPNSSYALIATIVLRIADKFVHENKDINANGLAPF